MCVCVCTYTGEFRTRFDGVAYRFTTQLEKSLIGSYGFRDRQIQKLFQGFRMNEFNDLTVSKKLPRFGVIYSLLQFCLTVIARDGLNV